MQQVGIYEQLITELISSRIDREHFYVGERELNGSEASIWLSRFLSHILEYAIDSVHAGDDRLQQQIKLSNELLLWLKTQIQDKDFIDDNLLASQGKILTALYELENPVSADLKNYIKDIFPLTGLTQSELFCGSNAGLSLESELKREILSADKIYWLVSFIKWAGIRIFRKELDEFTSSGRELKIITTSYMGATDAKAVEYLARLPNTEVKLSYNTERERLHAKSYLFLRDTGFHTGYIGSSNLSHSALTNGLEWNLKITSQEIPHIISKSLSTFETYWASNDFEIFNGDAKSTEKLNRALRQQRGSYEQEATHFFDITPFPHQSEILEQLAVERSIHRRFRNLVVAATGTGKTLISAFDFANVLRKKPDATFLFVAHREEILKQARSAYRGVLRNSTFGELWVGGHTPDHYRQLFVSIQTLNNQLEKLTLTADYYDYIVMDEVHHIAADSYRAVLAHFSPSILLGLTATPERHDGGDILADFGGVVAAEIRLPEAINRRHLCPFQYFAIDDDTDLRAVSWSRGRYDIAQLTKLYTYNQARFDKILLSLRDIITDITDMKALAFCVSREHAQYMTKQFLLKGVKADVLTSDNSNERQRKQQAIRSGSINVLCVVDIFNEGVDIPEVDTLLFLRPTESLTVFLQQLGRGLRLADDKECCTVLDFVGNSRPEYDFANKFRALVGKGPRAISDEIKQGFPHAPLGCRIELTKRTQEIVLSNIRQASLTLNRLVAMIRQYPQHSTLPLTLANFLLQHPHIDLNELYKRGSWMELVKQAQDQVNESTPDENLLKMLKKAVHNRILTCDDHIYLNFLKQLCQADFLVADVAHRYALMCHYDFWQKPGVESGFDSIVQSLAALNSLGIKAELLDMLNWQLAQTKHEQAMMDNLPDVPLRLHARYVREQILVAFGATTFERQSPAREGVLVIKDQNIELMFVTLNKNEKQFSPTTMYHDYAINEELFHWQSQNSARPDKGRGKDYIQHKDVGKRLFLFVREQSKDEYGRTMGFVNYGEVDYVSHTGSQPMNITWKLKIPMPHFMWQQAAKLAVG
ncbi:Putative DNA repair helicase RadD [Zhongshania aliphaticivorans]|uniref:DNA repair helicase RadD n=1 Tax=Zhongshania aliphaticivorans TaxID=1470434 RepID=A0A5S9PFT0_9GAMM|nr:DEAD/DEAH box helicase [Zhongshania aliphaticivorans]CAA0102681.1 Putative DNA repair helicase RadD [Zhongshania aliphaticivorans]CAA0114003.1 Putative DNA repair helicase RadD [Zhongshania aliphaticivorans]